MALTRCWYDKDRINTCLDRDIYSQTYMLNVPGNGTRPSLIDDPHVRLQKFGANISSNIVDINSNLKGIDRQLDRDCVDNSNKLSDGLYFRDTFPAISSAITDQPRAMIPAWQLRDLEQNNWDYLHTNPQNNTEILFANNLSSRILVKDTYDLK